MAKGEWVFLRNWLRSGTAAYNQEVRDYFRDVPSTQSSGSSPRAAALRACLIDSDDSGIVAMHKRLNFYFEVQASHKKPEIYGIPCTTFQEQVKFKTQIKLFFAEDWRDVELGYRPVEGRVSFRLMDATPDSISQAEVNQLATKIKNEFAVNGGYVWKKGKEQFLYREEHKGYQFRILARTEADAKELITKMLSVQDHTPDWTRLNISANSEPSTAYPTVPGNQTIIHITPLFPFYETRRNLELGVDHLLRAKVTPRLTDTQEIIINGFAEETGLAYDLTTT